ACTCPTSSPSSASPTGPRPPPPCTASASPVRARYLPTPTTRALPTLTLRALNRPRLLAGPHKGHPSERRTVDRCACRAGRDDAVSLPLPVVPGRRDSGQRSAGNLHAQRVDTAVRLRSDPQPTAGSDRNDQHHDHVAGHRRPRTWPALRPAQTLARHAAGITAGTLRRGDCPFRVPVDVRPADQRQHS